MTDPVLCAFNLNLDYARHLIEDVRDEQMCDQPAEAMNHPAWVLGHLVVVDYAALGLMGVDESAPQGWAELFGARTRPTSDRSTYPPKQTLVNAYEHVHQTINAQYPHADTARLDQPNERPRAGLLPTKRALLTHMLTTHEATHLGQLSAWRRIRAMPSAL